jgi:type IV secretory pathway VirB2 component (pilin)
MKKAIIFLALFIVFSVVNFEPVYAYTEAECNSKGGTCQAASCGNSSNAIGSCWESGNPNFNRTNCCGSVSNSQQTTTGGNQTSNFGNPISPSTIEAVLSSIMNYLRGIAGTIAVIFIIIGGIMYMMSIGDKNAVERAKKTLIFAIAGLAIVLAAPYFYQEIKAIIDGGSPGSALKDILSRVLQLLLSIVGFLAIISLLVGAIWMFTAVGDEDRYELGKKTATYSIIGLVIAVAALIIVNQVKAIIGVGSSNTNSNQQQTVPTLDQDEIKKNQVIGI